MFDYIKIEGFRSFKKVELNLEPLSVLIGPNGGGKSNLFDLLMLLREAGNEKLANAIFGRGGFSNIAFGFDPLHEVRVELLFKGVLDGSRVSSTLAGEELDVRFQMALRSFGAVAAQVTEELVTQGSGAHPSRPEEPKIVERGVGGAVFRVLDPFEILTTDQRREVQPTELVISQFRDSQRYPAASAVLRQLGGWTFYRDFDVGPQAPLRQPSLIRSEIQVEEDCSNLSSVLYAIQQDHPDDWEEITEILKTANPSFLRLTVPAEGGDGKVFLRWFETPFNRGQSANLLSDGTLKLLCLIAVLKNPDPPPLICIDEPELGLHPDWIKLVAELMQSAAARTQVIVATHSPQIVAKLDPEQVIVTEKHDGETQLMQLSTRDLEKWLDEFNLSDLWLAGHIGGRP